MGASLQGEVRPPASWAVAWERREALAPREGGQRGVTQGWQAVGVARAEDGLPARGRNLGCRLLVRLEGEYVIGSSRG